MINHNKQAKLSTQFIPLYSFPSLFFLCKKSMEILLLPLSISSVHFLYWLACKFPGRKKKCHCTTSLVAEFHMCNIVVALEIYCVRHFHIFFVVAEGQTNFCTAMPSMTAFTPSSPNFSHLSDFVFPFPGVE